MQIEIKNYCSFHHAVFEGLPPMVVVVGANGTGKSTLFDVFSFLKDSLTQNVATAVARRGGFRELVSRGEKGPIGITIKFRESGGRLATYVLQVTTDHGRIVVEREILRYRRGQHGKPWHFVDFSRGVGNAITNESVYGEEGAEAERAEYKLDDPSVLAIKGLGQFREFQVVSEFRSLIENWHVSDFHIADARPSSEAGYAEHLSNRGDNVAQVAQYLYEDHRECFDQVLNAMRQRVPGVSDVEAKPTEDGRLLLRFQDGSFKDPFIARYVSDGTIKMFAYLVLLYDPKPHPLLAVNEAHCVPARGSAAEIVSRIIVSVCAPLWEAGFREEHPAQIEGLARAGGAFRRGTRSGQRGLPSSEDQTRPTVPRSRATRRTGPSSLPGTRGLVHRRAART